MRRPTRSRYYVLDEHRHARATESLMESARAFESPGSIVAQTDLELCRVSTIFLGRDMRFAGDGPPIVFETMVFFDEDAGGQQEWLQRRYCTWGEAEVGHMEAVEELREEIAKLQRSAQEATSAVLARAVMRKASPAGPGA